MHAGGSVGVFSPDEFERRVFGLRLRIAERSHADLIEDYGDCGVGEEAEDHGSEHNDEQDDRSGKEVLFHDRFHGLDDEIETGDERGEDQQRDLRSRRYFYNQCHRRQNRGGNKASDQRQRRHAGSRGFFARKAFDALKKLGHHRHLLL